MIYCKSYDEFKEGGSGLTVNIWIKGPEVVPSPFLSTRPAGVLRDSDFLYDLLSEKLLKLKNNDSGAFALEKTALVTDFINSKLKTIEQLATYLKAGKDAFFVAYFSGKNRNHVEKMDRIIYHMDKRAYDMIRRLNEF